MSFHFFFNSENEIPKVVLGYDDYNINFTTIHCVIRKGDGPIDSISWERMSLLKDGVELNSVQNFRDSSETLILRLDKGERYNANYTCLLQVILKHRKPYNVSDGSFTRVKGKFYIVHIYSVPKCDVTKT